MSNNSEINIKGNRVKFIDGHLYVNGEDQNLKQWESNPKQWSNRSGTKQSEYSGKSLEEVLKMKGIIWSNLLKNWKYFLYLKRYMKIFRW